MPQDAVSWISSANTNGSPCVPTLPGCINVASLPSYDNIAANRKNYLNTPASLILDNSVRRFPDGGSWDTQAAPTYATCNSTCIQPGTSTCTGTATVTVSGGTPPYTYAWDDSQIQTTQTAINLCAGTYNVTVTDNGGLVQVFQATVEDFIPTVSVNLPTEICINANPIAISVSPVAIAGQTGTLTGTGVNTTNFNPGTAGVGSHTVNYFFEDEFGCSNTANDAILVNPLPIVSITNNQSPYCLSNTPAGLVLSPTGGQLTGTGVTTNQFIPSQAGVGTFTLTYTYQDTNGCSNSTTINVQVTAPAPPSLTIPSDLCIDSDTVSMIGNPTGGSFQIDGVASNNQFIAPNEGIGNHIVVYTVTDGNGCIATATENLMVHELPNIVIPVSQNYCYETGFQTVIPTPTGGTFTGDNVIGNGINTTGVIPGTYTVSYSYSDQFGCSNQETANYSITSPIEPNYVYETTCFQGATLVSLTQNPGYTYNWNIENIFAGSGSSYSATFSTPGIYSLTLTITDIFGCSYDSVGVIQIEEGVKIEKLAMPNIITPNGDGINDYFEMPLSLTECFEYEITIVNRWGNLIYQMDKDHPLFDGRTKNGNDLNEGVYFYTLKSDDFDCNDEKFKGICSGNITIVR
ncbi:T9SS C-terminal target domain-containing protein [Fluviicola taffensis]|uniref:PKD domain-containing protein n=1 Tax=Fluviicola taffensis (strain DSM 16823 / NCIMB 13979 / RW262) TaxID=755732 RepID=F2IC70_FLUTR|nr:T9SS C-terminal target domain-containing protein [Fluviicola taffensis]AEA43296.1 hypothetical protein Fluta_1301 [Fluviicola taffensis DSM 16823]